ncbi:MAG: DNA polymerase III subunit delta [Planctomycetaceae bacterium]|nr:DNA polymerase III subunit delta [Planctomycetaceae bacterium]
MHVTDYLAKPTETTLKPVIVLFGADRFLQQSALKILTEQLLGTDDPEMSRVEFTGKDVDLRTVLDEVRTISMWGDTRLVVVDDADDFVSTHRSGLEKYVEKPSSKSTLVLKVSKWPKNTRIAKQTAKTGLELECSPLTGGKLVQWLMTEAKRQYQKKMDHDAAHLLVELIGNDVGQVQQELEKLINYVGEEPAIHLEDVRKLVGGWKAETTWVMLDALRDGDLNHALKCYDQLATAGEAPQRLLGGITFTFKKLVHATELSRHGLPLPDALRKAGVFPRDINAASTYLRRIGRPRAERILQLLLQVDSDLKGGSRLSERIQIERLLLRLGAS